MSRPQADHMGKAAHQIGAVGIGQKRFDLCRFLRGIKAVDPVSRRQIKEIMVRHQCLAAIQAAAMAQMRHHLGQ